jgi:DnaJ-class molecular chaperone
MLRKIKGLFGGAKSQREKVPCPACEGTGQAICHRCGGSGLLSIPNQTLGCPECGKTGKLPCRNCGGTGHIFK